MNATITQKFNDDLLLTEPDRKLACGLFPELAHVLDFPDLRELFVQYEALANSAKASRQRAGTIGITLAVLALLGASVALSDTLGRWSGWAGSISAIFGVVGVVIGLKSALTGKRKQEWLGNRLMTERLRQFQFQVLVCRIPEVLASTHDSGTRELFDKRRKSWIEEFRLSHEGHLSAKLRGVLDDEAEHNFLLRHDFESRLPLDTSNPLLPQLFSAYRLLRLEHQLQYADYKLRPDEGIWSDSCARQLTVLRNFGLAFSVVVTAADLILVLSLPGLTTPVAHLAHLPIIWLLIGLLAVRATEDGLQPAREVERYDWYRSSMASLLARFDGAESNPEERVRVMLETERTVYREMRGFLRTTNDARYVL